jgi:trehalose utilization protein
MYAVFVVDGKKIAFIGHSQEKPVDGKTFQLKRIPKGILEQETWWLNTGFVVKSVLAWKVGDQRIFSFQSAGANPQSYKAYLLE